MDRKTTRDVGAEPGGGQGDKKLDLSVAQVAGSSRPARTRSG
ncbi:hypothetical protein ACFWFZ_21140 [Streptomyces sp. NPDC060232]